MSTEAHGGNDSHDGHSDSHSAGHGSNSISGGGAAAEITGGVEEVSMFVPRLAKSVLDAFFGGNKH